MRRRSPASSGIRGGLRESTRPPRKRASASAPVGGGIDPRYFGMGRRHRPWTGAAIIPRRAENHSAAASACLGYALTEMTPPRSLPRADRVLPRVGEIPPHEIRVPVAEHDV